MRAHELISLVQIHTWSNRGDRDGADVREVARDLVDSGHSYQDVQFAIDIELERGSIRLTDDGMLMESDDE